MIPMKLATMVKVTLQGQCLESGPVYLLYHPSYVYQTSDTMVSITAAIATSELSLTIKAANYK